LPQFRTVGSVKHRIETVKRCPLQVLLPTFCTSVEGRCIDIRLSNRASRNTSFQQQVFNARSSRYRCTVTHALSVGYDEWYGNAWRFYEQVLSTGPVGISDKIGATNASLIMATCDASGRLLQPSKPLTPSDRMYTHIGQEGNCPTCKF
jgi:hypothetical protein